MRSALLRACFDSRWLAATDVPERRSCLAITIAASSKWHDCRRCVYSRMIRLAYIFVRALKSEYLSSACVIQTTSCLHVLRSALCILWFGKCRVDCFAQLQRLLPRRFGKVGTVAGIQNATRGTNDRSLAVGIDRCACGSG